MSRGYVDFRQLRILVLDEADRMLDMGFLPDVRRILQAVPRQRQTMLFSATMPPEVVRLARDFLHDPKTVQVAATTAAAVGVAHLALPVPQHLKAALLRELLADTTMTSVLVFTRTKHRADRLARQLSLWGIEAGIIHGDRSQAQRVKALESFRSGRHRILVATDIAARGIDVEGVSHVVNFDVPQRARCLHPPRRADRSGPALGRCVHSGEPRGRGRLQPDRAAPGARDPTRDDPGLQLSGGRSTGRAPRDGPRTLVRGRPRTPVGRRPGPAGSSEGPPWSPDARTVRRRARPRAPRKLVGSAQRPAPRRTPSACSRAATRRAACSSDQSELLGAWTGSADSGAAPPVSSRNSSRHAAGVGPGIDPGSSTDAREAPAPAGPTATFRALTPPARHQQAAAGDLLGQRLDGRQGAEVRPGRVAEVPEPVARVRVDTVLKHDELRSVRTDHRRDDRTEQRQERIVPDPGGQGDVDLEPRAVAATRLDHLARPREEHAAGLVKIDVQDVAVVVEAVHDAVAVVHVDVHVGDGDGTVPRARSGSRRRHR